MNKISYLFLILALPLLLALTASPGHAEDIWYELPVKNALDSRLAAEKTASRDQALYERAVPSRSRAENWGI